MKQNLIIKYNNGNLAILCPHCRVIIKTGTSFTEDEMKAVRGEIKLPAYLCDKCKELYMKDKELSFDMMTHHILDEEDICDLMVAALEGGINYWCGSVVAKLNTYDSYYGVDVKAFPEIEYISDLIAYGGELVLTDAEDPTESWTLTQDKFINGVKQFMIAENIQSISELMDMHDADVADEIIQYALFNAIVFG